MTLFTCRRFVIAVAVTVIGIATVAIAAPTPKTPTDPRETASAGEPAEPSVDLEKLANSAVLKVRNAANRTTSSNNLKQIALAVHNYESANAKMPDNITDKDGKPILSWRVLLLPYLEEETLYRQFKLDEPWNSEHNGKLLEKMPKLFESPRVIVKKKGYTVYQGFNGPDGLFKDGKEKMSLANIPDGTSNTILAMEVSAAHPWTRPVDVTADRKKELPDLGKAYGGLPLVSMCDGSVRTLDLKKIKAETLKNLIDPKDGNVIDID